MDKEDVVYVYNGILPSHKKRWNLAIYSNTDGPWGCYVKWNKLDEEKQIPWFHSYVELKNKNKWTN